MRMGALRGPWWRNRDSWWRYCSHASFPGRHRWRPLVKYYSPVYLHRVYKLFFSAEAFNEWIQSPRENASATEYCTALHCAFLCYRIFAYFFIFLAPISPAPLTPPSTVDPSACRPHSAIALASITRSTLNLCASFDDYRCAPTLIRNSCRLQSLVQLSFVQ